MSVQRHVHKAYPQPDNAPLPGERLGTTASRMVGKTGAIITFTYNEGPNPMGSYWNDPDMLIDGNHYKWDGRRRGGWTKVARAA